MGETILELQNIAKHFGDTDVLNGISISIGKGEFITLLGPSGCGKTTTLRIIAGLETPDEGRVILNGQDVTDSEPNKRDVNTVFQNYALFPHMTVAANIGYSLKLKKRPKDEIKKAVDDALALVQLSGYGKRMPAELSGGTTLIASRHGIDMDVQTGDAVRVTWAPASAVPVDVEAEEAK